ncbi:hypothetical protein CLU79DRAFT_752623 [Phycomyces nitens]|nr:hypothetical protein CLU79DRAFT_752623 [Phycomyces nitens]
MQSSQAGQNDHYTEAIQTATLDHGQNIHQTMEIIFVSLSLLTITLLLVWIFCLRKRWQKNRVVPYQKDPGVDLEKGYTVNISSPSQVLHHPSIKSQPVSIMPEKLCDTSLTVVFAGQPQPQSNRPTRQYSSPFVDIPFRALMHSAIRTPITTNHSIRTLPRVKLPRHPMGRLYGRRAVSFTPSRKVPLQIACWMVSRKNKSVSSWYETQAIENDTKYKRSSV